MKRMRPSGNGTGPNSDAGCLLSARIRMAQVRNGTDFGMALSDWTDTFYAIVPKI